MTRPSDTAPSTHRPTRSHISSSSSGVIITAPAVRAGPSSASSRNHNTGQCGAGAAGPGAKWAYSPIKPGAAGVLPGRTALPNQVAVFSDDFIFTTMDKPDLARHQRLPFVHPATKVPCYVFSIDNEMAYTPFANDYGPLNLAYTFQACLAIHEKLHGKEGKKGPVCLYTAPDPKKKSNMALIAALYHLIVLHTPPSECFRAVAKFELMPFRDAGNGYFDYGLSVQDCLYGVRKAMDHGFLNLEDFDAAEYDYLERPQNGDMNFLGPFIPFASPIEATWVRMMESRARAVEEAANTGKPEPTFRPTLKGRVTTHGFKTVLGVFRKHKVGAVVRLNDELYDKRHFTEAGMQHVDLYFDDGSNPNDDIERAFIQLSEDNIAQGKKVAVHCKAGLGRTGVLIGAYLIYKHSFSAQEAMGFMRIVRPGMIVGPQQHYMLANQMKWVGWAARDAMVSEMAVVSLTSNPLATPPLDEYALLPTTRLTTHLAPAPHPKRGDAAGQPRKPASRSIRDNTPDSAILTDSSDRHTRMQDGMIPEEMHEGGEIVMSRGTKRGASRAPVPSARSAVSAPTRTGMSSMTTVELERSASISSNASANDRPRKRITGSPLATTGLSSPPASREGTPEDAHMESPISPAAERIALAASPGYHHSHSRSIPADRNGLDIHPEGTHTRESRIPRSPAGHIGSPPSRSFLQIRTLSPLREIQAVQVEDVMSAPSRLPRSPTTRVGTAEEKLGRQAGVGERDAIAGGQQQGKEKKSKEGWTPPRLMGMLFNRSQAAPVGSRSPRA